MLNRKFINFLHINCKYCKNQALSYERYAIKLLVTLNTFILQTQL